MRPAFAVVRGCCQTSAAQTGTRHQLPRQTQLLPASFYEHRFPLFCRTSLPPGRERRACCGYLNQGHGLSPLPQGKTTTPNYSLKHARSGSDTYTASTSSTVASTSPLQAVAILPLSDFHEISRAAGPKRHLPTTSRRSPSRRDSTSPLSSRVARAFIRRWHSTSPIWKSCESFSASALAKPCTSRPGRIRPAMRLL